MRSEWLALLLTAAAGCATTRLEVARDSGAEVWTSLQERSFRGDSDFSWKPRRAAGNFATLREVIEPTEPFEFVAGDAVVLCFREVGAAPPDGSARTSQSVLVIAVPNSAAVAGANLDAASLHVGWFDEAGVAGGKVRTAERAKGSVRLDAVEPNRIRGVLDLTLDREGLAGSDVRVRGEFEAVRRAR